MSEWVQLTSDTLFQSSFVKITKENFQLPSGKTTGDYIIAEKKDFVVIVPFYDGRILFLRQFRPGIKSTILNLPMGFIDDNEDPGGAAVRELQEETGMSPEAITFLGRFALAPGFCTFYANIFLCLIKPPEIRSEQTIIKNHDAMEGDSSIAWIAISEIETAIASSTLIDASSVLAVCLSSKHIAGLKF